MCYVNSKIAKRLAIASNSCFVWWNIFSMLLLVQRSTFLSFELSKSSRPLLYIVKLSPCSLIKFLRRFLCRFLIYKRPMHCDMPHVLYCKLFWSLRLLKKSFKPVRMVAPLHETVFSTVPEFASQLAFNGYFVLPIDLIFFESLGPFPIDQWPRLNIILFDFDDHFFDNECTWSKEWPPLRM